MKYELVESTCHLRKEGDLALSCSGSESLFLLRACCKTRLTQKVVNRYLGSQDRALTLRGALFPYLWEPTDWWWPLTTEAA